MKRFKLGIVVILASLFASLLTGCSSPSQEEEKEAVNFYVEFAKEATSLDAAKIREAYAGVDTAVQISSAERDKLFAKFNAINPAFFSKIQLTGSSNVEVGKTYSAILLLSIATDGAGVDVTMPLDAVSSYQDEKLGQIYAIDRTKITATVPESLGSKIKRSPRNDLAPVKLIKDGNSWKIIADSNMLTEVGTPLSEQITAPTTSSSK